MDRLVPIAGRWERRSPPDAEHTEWVYSVQIGLVIGLTCPPDHPDILASLWQNALDRIRQEGPEDTDLIDSYELIEIREE